MAQFTAHYNLAKPLVGGDIDLWGGQWNINADKIDVAIHDIDVRLSTAETDIDNLQASYVNKDGSVAMTGYLTLNANPLVDLHAVTKNYSDTNYLFKTGTAAQTVNPNVTWSGTQTYNNNISVASGKTATFGGAATFSNNASIAGDFTLTGSTFTAKSNLSIQDGTTEKRVILGSSGGYFYANATQAGWYKSNSAQVYWSATNGAFTASGDVTAFSDERLKEDIRQIQQATDLVRRMRGVWFTRVDTGASSVGVIAQEMQKVVPEVVHDNDGTLSVAYGNLVGVLIETIKEMDCRLRKLEAK
jgi:hypothetical protein